MTLKRSGFTEDFKYNPDDSCPTCLALRTAKVQVAEQREVIDKGERKRMRRLHGDDDDEEFMMEEATKIDRVTIYDNSKLARLLTAKEVNDKKVAIKKGEIEDDTDFKEAFEYRERKLRKVMIAPHKSHVFQAGHGERYNDDYYNRHRLEKDSKMQLQKILKDHDS